MKWGACSSVLVFRAQVQGGEASRGLAGSTQRAHALRTHRRGSRPTWHCACTRRAWLRTQASGGGARAGGSRRRQERASHAQAGGSWSTSGPGLRGGRRASALARLQPSCHARPKRGARLRQQLQLAKPSAQQALQAGSPAARPCGHQRPRRGSRPHAQPGQLRPSAQATGEGGPGAP